MSSGSGTTKPRVYGLTGGIASGKSTVAKLFVAAGIPVLDADQVTRELSAPGGLAEASILSRFGTTDRGQLREIVFKNPQARKDLETILHPLIRQLSAQKIAEFVAQGHTLAIYEAALLVETGRHRDFDGLIVVTSDLETRRARLIERDGCAPELADKILTSQLSDEVKLKAATHVIENSGSISDLQTRVAELITRLKTA